MVLHRGGGAVRGVAGPALSVLAENRSDGRADYIIVLAGSDVGWIRALSRSYTTPRDAAFWDG